MFLGIDVNKEPHVEFKKTNDIPSAASATPETSSLEKQLIPTLFDINLSVKKVDSLYY